MIYPVCDRKWEVMKLHMKKGEFLNIPSDWNTLATKTTLLASRSFTSWGVCENHSSVGARCVFTYLGLQQPDTLVSAPHTHFHISECLDSSILWSEGIYHEKSGSQSEPPLNRGDIKEWLLIKWPVRGSTGEVGLYFVGVQFYLVWEKRLWRGQFLLDIHSDTTAFCRA